MHSDAKAKQIDATYYPHVIDEILATAMQICPLLLRLVCKDWHQRVSRASAAWLELDLSAPGIVIDEQTTWNDDEPDEEVLEAYAWEFRAAELPVVYLHQSLTMPRRERVAGPGVDIKREARMLDIRAAVDFVRDGMSVNDFAGLHTVRIVQERNRSAGLDAAHMLAHVPRVIFSDGPYARFEAAAVPRVVAPCAIRTCARAHTTRLVVNSHQPVEGYGEHLRHGERTHSTLPRGLKELVVVFHGWGVVSGWHDAFPGSYQADPLNDVREIICSALVHPNNVRITVVNEELKDLRTGRVRTNYLHVKRTMVYFMELDVEERLQEEGVAPDPGVVNELVQQIEWLTLDEYRAKVGEEQFKIETMTDNVTTSRKRW